MKIELRKFKTHPYVISRHKKEKARSFATFAIGDILVNIYAFAPNIVNLVVNDVKSKRGLELCINKPKTKKVKNFKKVTYQISRTSNTAQSSTYIKPRKSKALRTRTI